jgi:hypothetical protein
MKRSRRTAAELVADGSTDPEYRARIAERDRKIATKVAEYASEDAILAREAAELGYAISSVWDFVNNAPHPFLARKFIGPYERAYPMLIRHLGLPHHPRVREGIIRALSVRDGSTVLANHLLKEFLSEPDTNMKWVLANALRVAMPYNQRRRYPEIAATLKRAGSI